MFRRALRLALFASAFLAFPVFAFSQAGPAAADSQARITALEQAVHNAQAANASAQSAGDNAWMLVSSALVLLMTGPGLALFYGGLVRKKNILGTMMQSFAMMSLVTIIWALFGYSLAFGHGNTFIGGFEHLFLRGVTLTPNLDYAATIPEQTYMIYQLMFAIITPALITGAFAERMKFSSMAVFLSLWSIIVYCPMAHMVWGVGGLLNAYGQPHSQPGFCGRNGGSRYEWRFCAGLRAVPGQARWLSAGRRCRRTRMVLSFIGACLLWVGWFGFNAGIGAGGKPAGHERVYQYALCRGDGGDWAGRFLSGSTTASRPPWARSPARGGAGGDYSGFGVCAAHFGAADRHAGRLLLLVHGIQGQELVRL